MATAYAAFTSLMHLISDLKEHPYPPIKIDEEHFDSLNSKVSFFQEFLEAHHISVDLKLELRIADAAYAAEDVIDAHIADEIYDEENFNASLQKAIEAMDLIEEEVTKMNWNVKKKRSQGNNDQPRVVQLPRPDAASNSGGSEKNNNMVGMEDLTLEIVDKLTLQQNKSGRRIISITGMGGIGKTTLARKVFDHKCIKDNFDVRAWAAISKDYNIHESLVELVHSLLKTDKESLRRQKEQELGLKLYQFLCGRRYLIIVDDLWDIEAWDTLRSFFPSSPGSRIVITTRESNFNPISSHVFNVDLLDEGQTWELFCKTVFGQDDCPRELEDVGRKISDNCRGLPLSVVVIGGHLAKSPRTQEYWKSIAENLSSTVNSEDNGRCMKILSLSYVHLPVHLKPCFLYMGIFPEDTKIDARKLIGMWVAEGFLKPINGKSLEEAAQDYISDLASRNLILGSYFHWTGIIDFKIHDLLRDLCLKEALEKKFYSIIRNQDREFPNNGRRIVLYPSGSDEVGPLYSGTSILKSESVLRSLILHDGASLPYAVHKSLRVLFSRDEYLDISLDLLVEVASQLVNLRCLDVISKERTALVTFPSSFLNSIWNLQSLGIGNCGVAKAPEDIWKMSRLRQIFVYQGLSLSNLLPSESQVGDMMILKNLHSFWTILNFSFSEDLIKRIPNVTTLAVSYSEKVEGFSEGASYALNNIALLEKLETLSVDLHNVRSVRRREEMSASLIFPSSLKYLWVRGLELDEDEVTMSKIGSLPLLVELYLMECSIGREWNPVDGQFVSLKQLELYYCSDLECFAADSSHFPCLEELGLSYMDRLKEISSSDIGDIQTLRRIDLFWCPDSAVVCAKEMADYQKHELGNEQLRIEVRLADESRLSAESLSDGNFIVHVGK